MTTCPPVNSVNCKCKAGIDWDYTLIQPLATAAQAQAQRKTALADGDEVELLVNIAGG